MSNKVEELKYCFNDNTYLVIEILVHDSPIKERVRKSLVGYRVEGVPTDWELDRINSLVKTARDLIV